MIRIRGHFFAWHLLYRPGLRDYLYRVFSGRQRRNVTGFQVSFAGEPLTGKVKPGGFVYICDVDDLPRHLKWRDFVKMTLKLNKVRSKERTNVITSLSHLEKKRFCKMERCEKMEVLLKVLPYIKGNIFLFYHTCKDLDFKYLILFKNQLQSLVKKGATVVYLSPDISVNEIKKGPCREILPLKVWTEQVESLEFEFLEKKESNDACEE